MLGEVALPDGEEAARGKFAESFRRKLNTVAVALEDTERRALLEAAGLSTRQRLAAWVDALGGAVDEDFADDPADEATELVDNGGAGDDLDFQDWDVDHEKLEVVSALGVKREDGFIYYFDDGKVMRAPVDDADAPAEFVADAGARREAGYLYFVDENGDVSRYPAKRRHGLPNDAPLVSDLLEWIGIDGGRDSLVALCDARGLARRKSKAAMEEQLADAYRGDSAALIADLRQADLTHVLGSTEGFPIGDGWWRLPDAKAKSSDELRATATAAWCRMDTSMLTACAADGGGEEAAAADPADDPVAVLKDKLAQYTGRRSIEIRSLLKKAGLGEFSRLRTDRFHELRLLIDAAGYALCDEDGAPFAADAASPGIDARVRLQPNTTAEGTGNATTRTEGAVTATVSVAPPAVPTTGAAVAGTAMASSVVSVFTAEPALVLEFLATFARFEYALKRSATYLNDTADASPNWDAFAKAIKADFATATAVDPRVGEAARYLRDHPPKKQIRKDDGTLGWKDGGIDGDSVSVLLAVRRVRNNLFHGGKFADGPISEVARDTELLKHSLQILRHCSRLDRDVQLHFEEAV